MVPYSELVASTKYVNLAGPYIEITEIHEIYRIHETQRLTIEFHIQIEVQVHCPTNYLLNIESTTEIPKSKLKLEAKSISTSRMDFVFVMDFVRVVDFDLISTRISIIIRRFRVNNAFL